MDVVDFTEGAIADLAEVNVTRQVAASKMIVKEVPNKKTEKKEVDLEDVGAASGVEVEALVADRQETETEMKGNPAEMMTEEIVHEAIDAAEGVEEDVVANNPPKKAKNQLNVPESIKRHKKHPILIHPYQTIVVVKQS